MQWFTCGSKAEIPPYILNKFNGVVAAGHHLSLWDNPSVFEQFPGKTIRAHFLYGNKNRGVGIRSNQPTIKDWVRERVAMFPQVNEWVLVNEFTGDVANSFYPGYSPQEVVEYFRIAHEANPKAKLILADFKPWMLDRWLISIKPIVEKLVFLGVPIELGIQLHIKTKNAPTVLSRLYRILDAYKPICPIHFIEVSVWWHRSLSLDQHLLPGYWKEIIKIGEDYDVKSICPWFLHPLDEDRIPTFENWKGGTFFNQDWVPKTAINSSSLSVK